MNKPRGFTLIEILCAATLSMLLVVGVLGVVAGLAKSEAAVARRNPEPAWKRRFLERLSRDFAAAEHIEPTSKGLRVSGPLATDPRSGVATWLPAIVEYRVESSPLGRALLRVETGAAIGDEPRHEVMALGVAQLYAAPAGEEILPEPGEERVASVTVPRGPPPPVAHLVLVDPAGEPLVDDVIVRP